ncbi:MAG: NPCBM/NEW2 domain-containing protein [Clostridia bacterium]|nr:NPCBM/NEW2 domain-containing protein [Clostridia bacterium]
MKKPHRTIALGMALLFAAFPLLNACGKQGGSDGTTTVTTEQISPAPLPMDGQTFSMENDALAMTVAYEDGSAYLTSLYNKAAGKDYLTDGAGTLFSYTFGEYRDGSAIDPATVRSDGGNWELVSSGESDIVMNRTADEQVKVGKTTEIVLRDEAAGLQVTLLFELYDGVAGMRYQTLLKNLTDQKIVITESDVISLPLPDEAHRLHYVSAAADSRNSNVATNSSWKSTAGKLKPNTGRNALCVYDSGDGWWIMPETNWRTQIGPESYGSKPSETSATYEFATTSCWTLDQSVKVTTNPDSLMLTLKPDEEFEYIGVNFTVFQGDVIDGKMAAEEHFYKRFLYHDTSTIINTNDWNYLGKRTTEYYEEVLIPAAKAAGIDMIMLDDLWNTDRDSIIAISALGSLEEFSELVKDESFLLGLWYSMSGGDHNNGRDLADPESLAEKIALVETLITEYGMNHMMVDLTEYWQNTEETEYSSPCDNVYRKNVMVQNALNLLVEKYPEFYVKPTNEVDVYPTQGNRSNGLLHVMNNGWVVGNGGLGNGMFGHSNLFGYLPLSATYGDGDVDGDIAEYYYYLFCRNVKLPYAPDTESWTEEGIALMAMFNAWRGGARVKALTDLVKRPSYLGENWDSADQAKWIETGADEGPYAWTYVNADQTEALLIATTAGKQAQNFTADLRWLDADKIYLAADVSLNEAGYFDYAFLGAYTGKELVENGFVVSLKDENAGGKAYWFTAVEGDGLSVVFADEDAVTAALTEGGGNYTLTVTGKAGAVATVILGEAGEGKGIVLSILIGADGKGEAIFTAADLLPAGKNGFEITPVEGQTLSGKLEFETLYAEGKLTYSGGDVQMDVKPDDGGTSGASGGDYRKMFFPAGEGSYVSIPVTVPEAGKYRITVTLKSNENQAKAALGMDGKILSEVLDLSTGVTLNRMYALSCEMELQAGVNEINVFAVEKGAKNSASTLSLRIDCIEYAPADGADGFAEAESHPEWGALVSNAQASGGKAVKLSCDAIGAYADLPLTLSAGSHKITLTFVKTDSAPMIALIPNGEGTGEIVDLYSADNTASTVTLTVNATGKNDFIRVLVIDKKNASSGYTVLLDGYTVTDRTELSANEFGITLQVGQTQELSALFNGTVSLSFLKQGESAFGVLTLTDGVALANRTGTAIVTAFDPVTGEQADVVITVVAADTPTAVLDAIEAVNAGDYDGAKSLYEKLSAGEKAQVTNFVLLKEEETKIEAPADEPRDVYYLEELDYAVNDGSTAKKGTCPSGSHKLQFTEGGKLYEHGLGFEPTTDEPGVLYMQIPENAVRFTVTVGLDSEMSKSNYDYDQKNTVRIWVDGQLMGETKAIRKNMQDGEWVDNTFPFDIELPAGATYLVIENSSGGSRTCDHILYADAAFYAE